MRTFEYMKQSAGLRRIDGASSAAGSHGAEATRAIVSGEELCGRSAAVARQHVLPIFPLLRSPQQPRMEVSGAPVGIVLCSRAHLWLTLGLVLLSGHSSAPRDATAGFWVRWPTLSDDDMTGLPERCIVAVTVVPKSIRSHVNRAPSKNVHAEGS